LAHPITGIGVGNFILFSFDWIDRHQVAHNTYLEVLAELGIFGLIVFSLLLWITFRYIRESYQCFRKSGQTRMATIGEGLEIGFTGFLFVASFLSIHYEYMFWVFLGFAGALRKIAEFEKRFY
jgi:O-antigen ligase